MKFFLTALITMGSISTFANVDLNCTTYLRSGGRVLMDRTSQVIEGEPFSDETSIIKFRSNGANRQVAVRSYMNFASLHFQKERDPNQVVAGGWSPWTDIITVTSRYQNDFADARSLQLEYADNGVVLSVRCEPIVK